ncbi:lysine--tRNA ligase [bacterium]|jgi:lysyl-tRNA synthetase class 1|nr:lysine--tRNA ligase [bacterium]MDP6659680.1 lysine--tRNA ligase [Candidatus Paceibacterota bacterium]|tara:strand:+ start:19309 stop:20880 length:1572 start_codon:yes stop_codon:yes gene_type:complete
MFWADKIVDDIENRLKKSVMEKESLVVRDEKTPSGRVHVGSIRGVAIHGIVSEILKSRGVENTFLYEFNDFDAFDSVPDYLDSSYEKYLGKPLYSVPAPEGKGNFAEFFASEFGRVIEASGFTPEFYYSSADYKAGKYNEVIKIALDKKDLIRRIYKETSGSIKDEDWFPLMVLCEGCGSIANTRVTSFDGEKVKYVCDQEGSGAKGCGKEGEVSPYDGNSKLPWKVEWAAKFRVYDVDIEGGGKDHSTRGGSRDVANHISKEVFECEPPYDMPYEFLLVGGKKMSSSKGLGSSSAEIAATVPKKIFRLALLGKDIKRAINFDPEDVTIPELYGRYDKIAEKYWGGESDDEVRLFELVHEGDMPSKSYNPDFMQVAFILQMPHLDLKEEFEKDKGSTLSEDENKELEERAGYAKRWLDTYAPERFIYKLQKDSIPESAKNLSKEVKELLNQLLIYIEANEKLDGGELHHEIHRIRKESSVEPAELFSAIYLSFLGKESGPKAGWFLSVLERDFLISRLKEVST